MPAGYSELFLEQGASFNTSIVLDDLNGVPFNLVNYSATSQMRKSYYSTSAAATFTISTGDHPEEGIIYLNLDSSNTANIYPGRYVYDVYVTNDISRVRVLEGIINVTPQATKLPGML
jgi:hypothetical protein